MNTGDQYPSAPPDGRRSYGMEERDWQTLAMAYDTWNDHVASGGEIDEDLRAFVRDVFDGYGLWDNVTNTPSLSQYRTMFMHRC